MTPTEQDLERAWGPLEPFSSRCSVVRACMAMHASGQVSELTAKLTAVDTMRVRIREFGGCDCSDYEVRFAIYKAILGGQCFTSMNSLILCLAAKHDVAVKVKISEMERSQMSALQIKLTAEDAAQVRARRRMSHLLLALAPAHAEAPAP